MKSKENGCGNYHNCLALGYDILGQVISILDVITDVVVCVQYYQRDRMIFFWISLTILLLALLAYDITFMINFSNERGMRKVALSLIMLPLSPFIPYLIYFTADPNSAASRICKNLCCFKTSLGKEQSVPENVSKLRQFMEAKVTKHLGFIVEALVEGIFTTNVYTA